MYDTLKKSIQFDWDDIPDLVVDPWHSKYYRYRINFWGQKTGVTNFDPSHPTE